MNIKKNIMKTMCAALTCTTVLSSMLAAYATNTTVYETPMDDSAENNSINTLADDSAGTDTSDSGWTTEENSFEDIKVTYQQSSGYTVTIPKTIALDSKKQAAYSVKVAGNIDANQRVYVAPVDGITESENLDFYMSDLNGKKENVVATVTQKKTYWSSENVANAYEETNNSVSAPNLTAGTWEGTFQVEIRLETEKEQEHTHDYVDGKCTCGAVDPNHTHNYGEDGKCTICGKETDPYETAPANAYVNWNYTLDNNNNIITLNYYKGSETDVIVYANYVIGGKTYKTQIASNTSSATVSTPYMFNGYAQTKCKNIKSVIFSDDIDTSNVTRMEWMFYYCSSLTTLDISNFNTCNVMSMMYMFQTCTSLTELDLSSFDTSNVVNMSQMFSGCSSLTKLNLSSFDTSKVISMAQMFESCSSLTELDLSNFDTSKVSNMANMFCFCKSLENLDVSSFDTSNVFNMSSMFSYCEVLESLNLSSFDTAKATKMDYMFQQSSNLKTIYATSGKWSTSQASTSNMFTGCGTSSVTYK